MLSEVKLKTLEHVCNIISELVLQPREIQINVEDLYGI